MSLIDAEQSIINRLESLRDCDIWVRTDPDRPAEQGIIQDNGSITVRHSGDQSSGFADTSRLQQRVTVSWFLDGRVRNLRSPNGLLVLRDSIYFLLLGFKPDGMGPLALSRWNLAERTQQYWRFELELQCEQLLMGVCEEPGDVGAMLQAIFFTPIEVTDRWGENSAIVEEFGPGD